MWVWLVRLNECTTRDGSESLFAAWGRRLAILVTVMAADRALGVSNRHVTTSLFVPLRVGCAVRADHFLELVFRWLVWAEDRVVIPVCTTARVATLMALDAMIATEVLQLARRQASSSVRFAGRHAGFL